MRIEVVQTQDAEAVVPLLRDLGYPSEAEAIRGRLEPTASSSEYEYEYEIWVARDGHGETTALAAGHLLWPLEEDDRIAQLTALVVAPHARGSGVGRDLVRIFEAWAAAGGATRAIVTSGSGRSAAHAFYTRMGYLETGKRFGKSLVREP